MMLFATFGLKPEPFHMSSKVYFLNVLLGGLDRPLTRYDHIDGGTDWFNHGCLWMYISDHVSLLSAGAHR